MEIKIQCRKLRINRKPRVFRCTFADKDSYYSFNLGDCQRVKNRLPKSWFWSNFPIIFVKEPAIRLEKSKNLTQNSSPLLRFLFSDSLLEQSF